MIKDIKSQTTLFEKMISSNIDSSQYVNAEYLKNDKWYCFYCFINRVK